MEELLHCEDDDDFEAEVESSRNNPEFMEFFARLSQEEAVVSLEAALLSEAALAEDWLRPEEDEAWSYLQDERSQEGFTQLSPQRQFVQLSFEERQHLLEQQAAVMIEHYKHTAAERNEWQAGDFVE